MSENTQPSLTIQDLGRALYQGISPLGLAGRAIITRGKRSLLVTSLETPNTAWIIKIEEV